MSFVKIWVHLVFSTKLRKPLLENIIIRQKIFKHILQNARKKEIIIDQINGFSDHIHVLLSMGKEQTIAKVAQLIKGESSRWINKNKLTETYFAWQDDYFAVSVSQSQVEIVRKYIKNQAIHHARQSFEEETEQFMEKFGFNAHNPSVKTDGKEIETNSDKSV